MIEVTYRVNVPQKLATDTSAPTPQALGLKPITDYKYLSLKISTYKYYKAVERNINELLSSGKKYFYLDDANPLVPCHSLILG